MSIRFSHLVKTICANTTGNMSMIVGVLAPVLLMIVGAAVDITYITTARAKLTQAADVAALTGAIYAEKNMNGRNNAAHEAFNSASPIDGCQPNIQFNDTTQEVTVTANCTLKLLLLSVFNKDSGQVGAESVTLYKTDTVRPLSLAFALDVSGSMNDLTSDGTVKIEALKSAIHDLFDALEDGSRSTSLLNASMRSGFVTYNSAVVDTLAMQAGYQTLETQVTTLTANGGTNSSPAVTNVFDMMLNDRPNSPEADQYLIFMTDGVNNDPTYDHLTTAQCEELRQQDIKVYTVAFAAPEDGQLLLLDCASQNTDEKNSVDYTNLSGQCDFKKAPGYAGPKGKGNGKALGHKKRNFAPNRAKCEKAKSTYYTDADDAQAIKAVFKQIGRDIAESRIRIKS